MNANNIESKFAAMGARLKVREIPSRWRQGARSWISPTDFAVDIRRDGSGEFFELRVPTHLRESLNVAVMQAEPKRRHHAKAVPKPLPTRSHPSSLSDRRAAHRAERPAHTNESILRPPAPHPSTSKPRPTRDRFRPRPPRPDQRIRRRRRRGNSQSHGAAPADRATRLRSLCRDPGSRA